MKPAVMCIATCLVLVPAFVVGQQPGLDQINMYSDAAFTSKEAVDVVPGTLTAYVVHERPHQTDGIAATFKIAPSVGFTGVWLSESSPFLVTGTSPNGIRIAYGGCFDLPVFLLEVSYTVFGTSEDCSYLAVVAAPGEDQRGPLVVDCNFDLIVGTGGRLIINSTPQCPPVPVESSTWGRVKALYR
jgi:hypothetical protein